MDSGGQEVASDAVDRIDTTENVVLTARVNEQTNQADENAEKSAIQIDYRLASDGANSSLHKECDESAVEVKGEPRAIEAQEQRQDFESSMVVLGGELRRVQDKHRQMRQTLAEKTQELYSLQAP